MPADIAGAASDAKTAAVEAGARNAAMGVAGSKTGVSVGATVVASLGSTRVVALIVVPPSMIRFNAPFGFSRPDRHRRLSVACMRLQGVALLMRAIRTA
jgi:hypothetical protein